MEGLADRTTPVEDPAMARLLTIEPESGLSLYVHGYCQEERLARAFAETWRALPEGDRTRMLDYWGSMIDGGRPYIEAIPPGARWSIRSAGVATCQRSPIGAGISFASTIVDRLPDSHLRTLIAREMAYVYLLATTPADCSYIPDEPGIAKVLKEWRFDLKAMNRWICENLSASPAAE
jgi:hypothetical protein